MEDVTKEAQQKGSDPLVWAIQMYSNLNSSGESIPSSQLAEFLVSYICWNNNVPILWKFLDKALILNIVPPMLLLSLLSLRFVIFSILVHYVKPSMVFFDIFLLLFNFIYCFLFFCRVIPCRHVQPAAYRLYLELIKRHAFELKSQINRPDYQK
jgi:hypothetical protein